MRPSLVLCKAGELSVGLRIRGACSGFSLLAHCLCATSGEVPGRGGGGGGGWYGSSPVGHGVAGFMRRDQVVGLLQSLNCYL